MLNKADARKARQADHATREQARLRTGDTRNACQRHTDALLAETARRNKAHGPRKARREPMSGQERAESYGGRIGGYETDETYCPD